MVTFLIVLFGLLLAFFCYVCIMASHVVVLLHDHTDPEVLDGEVVATINGSSIVRSSFDTLYCLHKVLPIDTEVVIRTSQEDQETVDFPKYHVSEKSGTRAQVVRRLNESVLLCRYDNKEIMVLCDEDSQTELTQKVEIPYRSYEVLGRVYTETEDALEIPFIRLDEVWQIPVCF